MEHGRTRSRSIEPGRATYRICSSSMECDLSSIVVLYRARSNLVVQHVESARVRWYAVSRAWSNSIERDRTWSCNISNLLEFDEMQSVEHGRTRSSSIEPGRATCRICSSSMECGLSRMVELDRTRSNLVVQYVESARIRWNVACRAWSNSMNSCRARSNLVLSARFSCPPLRQQMLLFSSLLGIPSRLHCLLDVDRPHALAGPQIWVTHVTVSQSVSTALAARRSHAR